LDETDDEDTSAGVGVIGNAPPPKCFEVTELCYKFLGMKGKVAFQVSLVGLMYAGLVGYSFVFVHSLDTQFPGWQWGGMGRSGWALVFSAVAVPLACCDLSEQLGVQMCFSAMQLVSLSLMLFGSIAAIFVDDNDTERSHKGTVAHVSELDLQYFGLLFGTVIFSQLFQHSVPGLLRPLRPRAAARRVFACALLTTSSVYCFLGTSAALYFGSTVQTALNTNWTHFTWGYAHTQWWGYVLNYIIVLFPVLNTLSIFPLVVVTLGNNLAVSFPRPTEAKIPLPPAGRAWTTMWRLIAAVPPIVAALPFRSLASTLQLAGFFGLYVAYTTPSLLQIKSLEVVERQLGSASLPPDLAPNQQLTSPQFSTYPAAY